MTFFWPSGDVVFVARGVVQRRKTVKKKKMLTLFFRLFPSFYAGNSRLGTQAKQRVLGQ